MKKACSLIGIALGGLLGLFSCVNGSPDDSGSAAVEVTTSDTFAFDTAIRIQTYHGENDVHDEIIALIQRLDSLFDPYDAPKDGLNSVYTINHADGEFVEVDQLLFDALLEANRATDITGGLFNPLIGKTTSLWKEALYGEGHAPYLPDEAEIAASIQEAAVSELVFDEASSTIKIVGGAHIDLGGIAKGFALDSIIDVLERHGISDFLIQLSASSIGLGNNPRAEGGLFNIRINTYGGPLRRFHDKNAGLSTSATYEQQVMIGSDRYSHIVNPLTGSAIAENDLGVVRGDLHENALLDAISTAVCLTPGSQMGTLETSIEVKGIDIDLFVMKDGHDVYVSEGFDVQDS